MCPTNTNMQCWTCSNSSKYKCPKCCTKSCSLKCVNKHKDETGCDGLRDKVKFLSLTKFTDMDIVNDFRLMEEVNKQVDKCKRDKLKRSTRQGDEMMIAPRLQKHLQRLQTQARNRGCRVSILPPHFARRKNNTSTFDWKEKVIKWHVELKFININQTITLSAVSERIKLWRLISDYVEVRGTDDPDDPFQLYRSVSYGGLCLYLKAEGQPNRGEGGRRFYPLDIRRSLKYALKDTSIVEHPIIHVVFTQDECLYREAQDCLMIESSDKMATGTEAIISQSGIEAGAPSVGEVLSHADAMQADPEAYKKYFDFYLKYYTSKYAQEGANLNEQVVTPGPFTGLTTPQNTSENVNSNSNTYPNRLPQPSANPLSLPQYGSTSSFNKSSVSEYPNRSSNPKPSITPSSASVNHTQINFHRPMRRKSLDSSQLTVVKNQEVNKNNMVSAKLIQQELKNDNALTSSLGLVAYADSDSE